MKKKSPDKEQSPVPTENRLEEIRQLLKKQKLQTDVLKKIIERKKDSNHNK